MADFTERTLTNAATLGERLRELRREARLSVAEAAARTRVPVRHLEALEVGRYQQLPGDVYTRNFLRRYAQLLQVSEERVLERYAQERSVVKPAERPLPSPLPSTRVIALTAVAKRAGIGLVIAAILVYLGLELAKNITPPSLELASPPAASQTSDPTVEVRGRSEPEVTVTVNRQPIPVAQDGSFSQRITLAPGTNTLVITAAKKRGRGYTVTRVVVYEPPTPTTTP